MSSDELVCRCAHDLGDHKRMRNGEIGRCLDFNCACPIFSPLKTEMVLQGDDPKALDELSRIARINGWHG